MKVGFWGGTGSDTESVSLTEGVKKTNNDFFEMLKSIVGEGE